MTEQRAKTKWCPMRRIIRMGDVRIDNTDGKEFTLNCIGSDCMMWRWEGETCVAAALDPSEQAHGYCGLAGPQP